MTSIPIRWPEITLTTVIDLVIVFFAAVLINRFLRAMSKLFVKGAATSSRAAQMREQQTRTLADVLYGAASKVVWAVAILTAMTVVHINPVPALTVAGLASVAVGFGAQSLVRDVIAGFYIVFEDQFAIGDTIQVADMTGRVEHLTLRRTVVRDARGALVTIANGEIRMVSNLSRDWSQTFVDISLAPELALDRTMQALESASAEMRNDPSWSQALVDGPRILGVQAYDRTASTVRLQIRTAPTRQDEVSRELRRRIQMEFQRQGLPLSGVQRIELAGPSAPPQEKHKPGAPA
ncbi:MAG TPA: mechanosensitive ion channel family protein [Candidatus Methylomirabilis sp.]|nr:mechanosensitive ion channel family protein [Candidatus Methylomirabilis sp.]